MAIPTTEDIFHPMLKILGDGKEHQMRELTSHIANIMGLTEEERDFILPSGSHKFNTRVWWARVCLVKAGLLVSPSRGKIQITDSGKQALQEKNLILDIEYLRRIPLFQEWEQSFRKKKTDDDPEVAITSISPPEETLESGYKTLRLNLATELLDTIKSCSPQFFERLVVDLLLKMGYGGSFREAGHVIGKSGDGGIDGLIKEDKLGLDVIYLQAKRYRDGQISSGDVRNFSGGMDSHGAKKGVFITTSSFTKDAKDYVTRTGEKKIVLIDGYELAQLMIDHDLGVNTTATYAVKKIDSDYFEEE